MARSSRHRAGVGVKSVEAVVRDWDRAETTITVVGYPPWVPILLEEAGVLSTGESLSNSKKSRVRREISACIKDKATRVMVMTEFVLETACLIGSTQLSVQQRDQIELRELCITWLGGTNV